MATIGLRVVHLVSSPGSSGAFRSACALARWMSANGHAALITGLAGGPPVPSGVEVRNFQERGWRWVLYAPRMLAELIGDWKPDLIHVHSQRHARLGLDTARRLSVPLVIAVHREWSLRDARILKHPAVDMVLVPSEALRAHVVGRLGVSRDRVALLPNGIDLVRAPMRRDPGTITTIGMIASLERHPTAFSDLIGALASLRQQHPQVRGLLVGGEGAGARLQEELAAHDLTDAVRVEDLSDDPDKHLGGMDLLVHAFDEDAGCACALGAMARGCVVVASAVGGIREMVQEGRSGLLVPAGDGAALALALRKVVADQDLARRLSEGARTWVAEHQDIGVVGQVAHAIYRAVLRGPGNTGAATTETATVYRRISSEVVNRR